MSEEVMSMPKHYPVARPPKPRLTTGDGRKVSVPAPTKGKVRGPNR